MEDHKGYITVRSTLAQGTTFSLFFPVTREVDSEIEESIEKIKGNGERILIVEDTPVQRRVASQLLKRLDYIVHTVSREKRLLNMWKSTLRSTIIARPPKLHTNNYEED